jgi:hypothetical protein
MLAASRLHRPVPRGLHTYLADLLTNVDTYEDMTAFAAPFIAGCLALDNYAYDVPCQCCLCDLFPSANLRKISAPRKYLQLITEGPAWLQQKTRHSSAPARPIFRC